MDNNQMVDQKIWVVTSQSGMHYLMINLIDKDLKDYARSHHFNYSTVWHSFKHIGNLKYASQVYLKDIESMELVIPANINYWQRKIDGDEL